MAAKSSDSFNKKITLDLNGKSYEFVVTPSAYINYVNDLQADDKVTPHHTLLVSTVNQTDKDELVKALGFPPAIMSLGAKLLKIYTEDVEVTVKK